MHDQRVLFTINSKSFEASARLLDKPNEDKLDGEKSHLMHRKYGWSDGLIVELIPYKEQVE
jgi:hypothetical protein